jgi:hypothetical protein
VIFVVTRYLAERRPGRAGSDVLAAAAAAAKVCADVGNRKGGAELCDEYGNGHYGIMPAKVAPAEDADLFVLEIAKYRGAAPFFLFLEVTLFHASHVESRPAVSIARDHGRGHVMANFGMAVPGRVNLSRHRKEHNRNIFPWSSAGGTPNG